MDDNEITTVQIQEHLVFYLFKDKLARGYIAVVFAYLLDIWVLDPVFSVNSIFPELDRLYKYIFLLAICFMTLIVVFEMQREEKFLPELHKTSIKSGDTQYFISYYSKEFFDKEMNKIVRKFKESHGSVYFSKCQIAGSVDSLIVLTDDASEGEKEMEYFAEGNKTVKNKIINKGAGNNVNIQGDRNVVGSSQGTDFDKLMKILDEVMEKSDKPDEIRKAAKLKELAYKRDAKGVKDFISRNKDALITGTFASAAGGTLANVINNIISKL